MSKRTLHPSATYRRARETHELAPSYLAMILSMSPSSRSAAGHQALNSPILWLVMVHGWKSTAALRRPAAVKVRCKRAQMTLLEAMSHTFSLKIVYSFSINGMNICDIANFIHPFIIYF